MALSSRGELSKGKKKKEFQESEGAKITCGKVRRYALDKV